MSDKIEFKSTKIVIIGAGYVGSTLAYSLMINETVSEIVLIDIDENKAKGEALDLDHGNSFISPSIVRAGDYKDCEGADIIVLTAGVAQKPGESRLDLADRNVRIFRKIIPEIKKNNEDCILLVSTNPVDVMTYYALKLSNFSPSKVIGSGTILDTSRLRYLLGEHLQIDPRKVHAYVIGEHGDSEVPVWSLANVAGVRLRDFCILCNKKHDVDYLNSLFKKVKNAAYEIIELKGRTNYAIGLGLTRIIQSIMRNENSIFTVSSLIKNYYGVSNICISIPTILNRNGIREVLEIPLNEEEIINFKKSGSILKNIIESLNILIS